MYRTLYTSVFVSNITRSDGPKQRAACFVWSYPCALLDITVTRLHVVPWKLRQEILPKSWYTHDASNFLRVQLLFTNDSACAVCSQVESFFPPPFKESLWVLQATYSANTTVSFPRVRACRGLRLTKDFPVRRVKRYSTLSSHFLQAFALYFGAYVRSRFTFWCQ